MIFFFRHSHFLPSPRINPRVKANPVPESLSPSNAVELLNSYDVILDCTDNAPTRYLLSDTAVILGKPLVSGAAQQFDGQLCTYNFRNGPCYRCIFPTPSPSATSCEESGILGVAAGIIGNLQALEAIKILTDLHGKHRDIPLILQHIHALVI
jgi:adenylyltransferase and sulfurtransferase